MEEEVAEEAAGVEEVTEETGGVDEVSPLPSSPFLQHRGVPSSVLMLRAVSVQLVYLISMIE